jgi:hypothetical protein
MRAEDKTGYALATDKETLLAMLLILCLETGGDYYLYHGKIVRVLNRKEHAPKSGKKAQRKKIPAAIPAIEPHSVNVTKNLSKRKESPLANSCNILRK